MKGIINVGAQEYITLKFGFDVWDTVKTRAGCKEPFFTASKDYPDAMTMDLIKAASDITGIQEDTLLIELGKHWVPVTGSLGYPQLYQIMGKTARDLLLNIDKFYHLALKNRASDDAPWLDHEVLPDGRMLIHYCSSRQLCSFLQGVILGIGIYFGQKLDVREIACLKKGSDTCIMEVTFHES